MKVFILSTIDSIRHVVDIRAKLAIGLHELLGKVDRFDHSIAQRLGVETVEH